jgi:RNA polymerase sigma-70 factor (ECF subfamily)
MEKGEQGGMGDRDLLGAIARGSRSAFQAYYERHAGRLMGYVLRAARDRSLAEDVVQEVFTSIWLKASTYRPELGTPLSWMYMVARNKLVDRWRRQPPTDEATEHALEDSLRELVRADPELAMSLERAMEALRPEQREAVELACLGGYTHEEAAVALAVPLGTLKSRIRVALGHMRSLLTE